MLRLLLEERSYDAIRNDARGYALMKSKVKILHYEVGSLIFS